MSAHALPLPRSTGLYGRRVVALITAYFDESQHGRYLVFAGYLSFEDRWKLFEEEWAEMLSMPPSIPFFHATEMSAKDGVCAGWTDKERQLRFQEASRIVKRYVHCGLAVQINLDLYERVKHALHEEWRDPYYLGYASAIGYAIRAYEGYQYPRQWTLDVIFDEHKLSECAKALAEPWAEHEDVLARIDSDDDRKVPGLQAADMLAFRMQRAASGHKHARLDIFAPVEGRYIACEDRDEPVIGGSIEALRCLFALSQIRAHQLFKDPKAKCQPALAGARQGQLCADFTLPRPTPCYHFYPFDPKPFVDRLRQIYCGPKES